jgi:hypothetical protein
MKLSAHFLVKGQDYRKVYTFKDIVAANVSEVDTHVKVFRVICEICGLNTAHFIVF